MTITVALAADPPPQALLNQFTEKTGITVNWLTLPWDDLQAKISEAATAKAFFADATNVDWSRVGELGELDWFYPLEDRLDVDAMRAEVPQLESFTKDGHVVGIPYDASYLVTTVNTEHFANAGITTMPTTIHQYTEDLRKIKKAGVVTYPLSIPFAAAEGLSTYWYQTTNAFGGTVLDELGAPQFASPDSAGHRAARWMVAAFQEGLVPPGNIDLADQQAQRTQMARGQVASTFADYSGVVGSLYESLIDSSVPGRVQYLMTPGVSGPAQNISNPDGIGIPRQAQHPEAAASFIDWFTSAAVQEEMAGLGDPRLAWAAYTLPSHVSSVEKMATSGKLAGGPEIAGMLKTSRPVFPQGAPTWYPQFSRAVFTNLHDAATGSITVDQAMKAVAATATELSGGA
ncbi:carbohydrate ABC transporter substrate-binding protein, CUT1 family [Quadrisphaera granulorum]|uniref:Carbohydrate ABC transporter substrate-binding protein (CUT1 family) n=1 Tax=Quadrisphaera granulorum TaxID=317664 RepID=A0A316ABI8_9ACTN|nr:extracellular solute-binding protein [Quadrisphaera granulorum]PWJ54224.1 carbohydrate ABC transporter substrate-binding protein (CUT1 family) [Quadrisphaera granulorum]SZE96363.1 carbohydrate ABC transporter substrate-binding protein, CUT1 family [Quadrisphaera granulorum]